MKWKLRDIQIVMDGKQYGFMTCGEAENPHRYFVPKTRYDVPETIFEKYTEKTYKRVTHINDRVWVYVIEEEAANYQSAVDEPWGVKP